MTTGGALALGLVRREERAKGSAAGVVGSGFLGIFARELASRYINRARSILNGDAPGTYLPRR